MNEPDQRETAAPAVGTPLDCGVGRPVGRRLSDGERQALQAALDKAAPVVARGRLKPERAKDAPLSHRQSETMKKAPDDWADLPSGMGCTNATIEALERRGLVETRIEPSQRHSWYAGWQWRKTPNDQVKGPDRRDGPA